MPTTLRPCRPRHKVVLFDLLLDPQSPRKKVFDAGVACLILASVGAFLYGLTTAQYEHPVLERLEWFFVAAFSTEYLARFYATSDFLAEVRAALARPGRSFRRNLWRGIRAAVASKLRFVFQPLHLIDLIALLPAFRVFRIARLFRLLRLFQFVSYQSTAASIAGVFREHAFEFAIVSAFVVVVLVFSATGMFLVEHESNPEVFPTLEETLWWAIVTMTTVGYGDKIPITAPGRVLAAITMIAGICVIALPTAIFTSALMEKMNRLKEGTLQMASLGGHVVICGLSKATDTVVREIARMDQITGSKTDVVVIAAFGEKQAPGEALLRRGDFTRESVLREAGAERASAIIVLAERRTPDTPDETVDARSTLAALVADAINPKATLAVEVLELDTTRVLRYRLPRAEVIESGALGPRLMAVSAVHQGVAEIVRELLTTEGNDFWEIAVGEETMARTPRFGDLFPPLRARNAIPFSVRRGGEMHTNPPDAFALEKGDVVFVISREAVDRL